MFKQNYVHPVWGVIPYIGDFNSALVFGIFKLITLFGKVIALIGGSIEANAVWLTTCQCG